MIEVQPAQKSYFFEQCYRDILNAMKKLWDITSSPIINEGTRLFDMFSDGSIIRALFSLLCDAIVFPVISIVILIVNAVFSGAASLVCLCIAGVMFLMYGLMAALDNVYCLLRGIGSHCPSCQQKQRIPVYMCPNCHVIHSQLKPSKYGIFYRRCNCGEKLPTTFLNGRQRLTAVCGNCGTKLKDGGKHVEIMIPIVGGASAGKTCFITSAIVAIEKHAGNYNMNFNYLPNNQIYNHPDDYLSNKKGLSQGLACPKTSTDQLHYYQFYLTKTGEKIQNLISLCDVTGESYEASKRIGSQVGMSFADAFIMILDPLAMQEYRKQVERKRPIGNGYGASKQGIDDVLNVLINTLANMKRMDSQAKIKTELVIVINKCDIPGLADEIGSKAVNKYMATHSRVSELEAQNKVCMEFFKRYGEMNFWNTLISKFKNFQFFTCSALGRAVNKNDHSAFVASGTEEPVMWLIQKIMESKVIH